MDEAASALSLAGARIVEVALPSYELMEAVGAVIIHVLGLRLHGPSIREHEDLWGRMGVQTIAARGQRRPRFVAERRQPRQIASFEKL